jgi:hypothetical protein
VSDDVSVVRLRAATVLQAGAALRATTLEARAHWLALAARTLEREVHRKRNAVAEATSSSVPMVEWATRTTLGTVVEDALLALVRQAQGGSDRAPDPIAMMSVVLAGNVFTASVRAIVVPLLFGVPVVVKASSKETLFPDMLRDALVEVDSRLGAAIDLVVFPGGDVECEAALFELAEAVSVYGSDETVEAIDARLGSTPLVTHGHGVSVAYCGPDALDDVHIGDTIANLSLDICAYDQRGCLSPQVVYVAETLRCSAASFARRLALEGLGPMGKTLPRGPLPLSVGAEQAQWRGVAEVEGTLVDGDTYAVSIRAPQPIRWSPGFRNVTVAGVRGLDEALRAMEPIGSNLKCIGTDSASLPELQARLADSPAFNAYACTIGTMQTPSLDAPADGRPIWHGLFQN